MEINRTNLLELIKKGLVSYDLSIASLEKNAGVPKDTVRDFLRGKTQILRADKLQKILRILQPQEGVFLSGHIGAEGEVFLQTPFAPEQVPLPPGLSASDITAVRVQGDSMLPLFYDGWIIYYNTRHDAPVPVIREGWQVPYTENTSGGDPLSGFFGKPCVIQLKDGPLVLKTLKRGDHSGRYHVAGYYTPTLENREVDWAAKIVFIKPV